MAAQHNTTTSTNAISNTASITYHEPVDFHRTITSVRLPLHHFVATSLQSPEPQMIPAQAMEHTSKQDIWHQRHVFSSPSPAIPHPYSTRYSTTHTYKPPQSSLAPSHLPLSTRIDQPSGATRNHSTLREDLSTSNSTSTSSLASTSLSSSSPSSTSYYHSYPRPTESITPSPYARHDSLPPITFPSPIVTTTAYYHDDIKYRPSAYTTSTRYAYPPPSTFQPSTNHSDYQPERPSSSPSPYPHPSTTNGYTRNNAFLFTDEFPYSSPPDPACRSGRFQTSTTVESITRHT
jgi:hypothetical protein